MDAVKFSLDQHFTDIKLLKFVSKSQKEMCKYNYVRVRSVKVNADYSFLKVFHWNNGTWLVRRTIVYVLYCIVLLCACVYTIKSIIIAKIDY